MHVKTQVKTRCSKALYRVHCSLAWDYKYKISECLFEKIRFKSNLESIAGSIQAYHDAVFVGTGKKCDRKRNRRIFVTDNIRKV